MNNALQATTEAAELGRWLASTNGKGV